MRPAEGRLAGLSSGTWDCPVGPEPTRPGSGALSVTMADVNEARVRHCSGFVKASICAAQFAHGTGYGRRGRLYRIRPAAFFVVPQPRNGAAFGYTGHIVKLVDAWKTSLSD